jgi:hypothetical protein
MNEIDRVEARIDDLQRQLRHLVESPAFDQKMAELEYRIDQFAARLRAAELHDRLQETDR